jgi:hypothetical protein
MRDIAEVKKNAKARDATPYPPGNPRASLAQLRRTVDHEARAIAYRDFVADLKVAKKAAIVGGK